MFGHSKEFFKKFMRTFLPFYGNELASAGLYIVIIAVLGSYGNPFYLNSYRMNKFLSNLLIMPLMMSILEVGGVMFSIGYGAKDYKHMKHDFYKIIFSFVLFFVFYGVTGIFSKNILLFFQLENDLAEEASFLYKWSIISNFFQCIRRFSQSFISAQGHAPSFIILNLTFAFSGWILIAIFVVYLDLRDVGTIPAKIIQESLWAFFSIIIFIKKVDKKTIGKFSLSLLFKNYFGFLKRLWTNWIGAVLEWLEFEVNILFAIQLKNHIILSVCLAYSAISHFFTITGVSFSSTIRVLVGFKIGEHQTMEAKKALITSYFYISIASVLFTIVLLLFRRQIAFLIINNNEIANILSEAIVVLACTQWGYLMLHPFFKSLRILEQEQFFVILMITYSISINLLTCAILVFYFSMGSIGIVLGQGVSSVTTGFIFMAKVLNSENWKDFPERRISEVFEEEIKGLISDELKD